MTTILHLTVKKKWFDMIASGWKTEEYREMKPYWKKRLQIAGTHPPVFKNFDLVEITNGYGKNKPKLVIECRGILATWGKPAWGGDDRNLQYVIKLGAIISHTK